MTLPLPQLDKRTWQDLVDEGLARIHRRAPEWTDYNLHDPGITLLELLAYKSAQRLYQANRVTDRLLTNVYRLMNNDSSPVPTSVVAFTGATESDSACRGNAESKTRFDAGTTFELIQNVESEFPTTESSHVRLIQDVDVHDVRLKSVMANRTADGLQRIASGLGVTLDSTTVQQDSVGQRVLCLELSTTTDADRNLCIYFEIYDELLSSSLPQVSTNVAESKVDSPFVVVAQIVKNNQVTEYKCAFHDETNGLCNSGIIRIKVPGDTALLEFYWCAEMPWPAHRGIRRIVLNAARVEHCRGMNSLDEDRISSFEIDEHGFHSVDLRLPVSRVEVQQADANCVKSWTQCQSLMTATENDSWFELDGTVLRFGNGKNGMRPPGNGCLSLSYVVRQSIDGIVVGSNWRPVVEEKCKAEVRTIEAPVADLGEGDARPGIQSESRNLSASMQLAELALKNDGTLDGLARVRVMSIPAPMNAVIPVDFERLALGLPLPRIARARAYQEIDVTSPGLPGSGTLSLVVYPDMTLETVVQGEERTLEVAREELANRTKSVIEAVHRRLEAYRVMGTRLVIGVPRLCELRIMVTLEPTPNQGLRHKDSRGEELSRVRSSIMQRMRRLFDPVTGGPNGAGYPFGDHVSQREIFAAVSESLEGFALTECEITPSGKWWPWSLPYVTVTIAEGHKQRALR